MTIYRYYVTYGFKIKKEDYLKMMGYTLENLPNDFKPVVVPTEEREVEYVMLEALQDWIRAELHLEGNYTICKRFEVGGEPFIVRGFTHDSMETSYVVVGVHLAIIHNFDGEISLNNNLFNNSNAKEKIKFLFDDFKWFELISKSHGINAYSRGPIEHGIPDPKCNHLMIQPQIYMTQNDCGCCS